MILSLGLWYMSLSEWNVLAADAVTDAAVISIWIEHDTLNIIPIPINFSNYYYTIYIWLKTGYFKSKHNFTCRLFTHITHKIIHIVFITWHIWLYINLGYKWNDLLSSGTTLYDLYSPQANLLWKSRLIHNVVTGK